MGVPASHGKQCPAGSMAPRNAVEGSLEPPVGRSKESLGKVEEKFQGSIGRSPSPQYSGTPSRSTTSTPRSSSSRCGRSHSERRSSSHLSTYTRSTSRGRIRSSSPALDLWEAQRNLERGDFIEGVLTTMPPGPFIQCQPVGITPSGGHLLGPATGRPLPWL